MHRVRPAGNGHVPDEPPSELRFRRHLRPWSAASDLWRSRELIRSLAERQIRSRYKQAFLGFAWALITPILLMVVFTLFFNRLVNVDTGGAPYPLFSYLGLLPWTFFSTSVSQGGLSLLSNARLLNKLPCPREVFPLSSIVVAAVDLMIATTVLGLLFLFTGYAPRVGVLWALLPFLAIQVTFTAAVTLAAAAITVYLRDLRHGLPIILQLGLFSTPVAYGLQMIPDRFLLAYSVINPLGPVIDAYRSIVLYGVLPRADLAVGAGASSLVMLLFAYALFKRLELRFADVA